MRFGSFRRWPVSTQATRWSGSIMPSAIRCFRPAIVAAEAGSQPRPCLPIIALASLISSSGTAITRPLQISIVRRHFFRLTGREISIADAIVWGEKFFAVSSA